MVTGLFDFLPESTNRAPAPPPPAAPPPPPAQAAPAGPRAIRRELGVVASFACHCGAQDEVLEPAPEWVACWQKGCAGQMHRWTPRNPPPSGNARRLTPEEQARIGQAAG